MKQSKESCDASYNPATKHVILNILGDGFSTLATKDMQEFLEKPGSGEKRIVLCFSLFGE